MIGINQKIIDKVIGEYTSNFGMRPEVVLRSPGRINLIGEHTDYNNGFVLPSAVSLGIYFAIGPNSEKAHNWHSVDKNESIYLSSENVGSKQDNWSDFIHGSWLALTERNPDLPFFNVVFSGDLPMSAGMSSSSALTCGVVFGLNELFNLKLDKLEIASTAHRVEREFIGLRGGIMDQYASVLSESNQLLLLDCNDLSHTSIPFEEHVHLFLINTNVHRELTESGYNNRSDECALAVQQIKAHMHINSLRDITKEELLRLESIMDVLPFKRAKYVIDENQRVHDTVDALTRSDWHRLGQILYAGHEGLRTEYEVSIAELDFLVEYTRTEGWIFGARMMGGGFGGCTINVSKHKPSEAFIIRLTKDYHRRFGINPTFIPVSLTGGTRLIDRII